MSGAAGACDGLLIVDKPSGWTSHDVVAKVRRLARTRRVGHAGTLDPMATGVLVLGIGRATRLLGHLTLTEKEYAATIRLGQETDTGDADGEVVSASRASGLPIARARSAARSLTGRIWQVPPAVSAVKVGGVRSYRLARAGQAVELAARPVTVTAFEIAGARPAGDVLDLDARVVCSSGAYVRALARDLGAALGVGGHLVMLRRTRVGPYGLAAAHTLADLERGLRGPRPGLPVIGLAQAAAAAFPVLRLTAEQAGALAHGAGFPLPAGAVTGAGEPRQAMAAIGPDGALVALVREEDGRARPLAVFPP